MSPDPLVRPIVQAITGLAKKKYEQWTISTAIEAKVHAAFSQVATRENMQRLSFDAVFCYTLFRLAEGDIVDAEELVKLGTAKHEGKPVVAEAELITDLKDFAYQLLRAWQDISPKSGDVPTAFTIFHNKINQLAHDEAVATRIAQSAKAAALQIVEVHQRELEKYQQQEQKLQEQLRMLAEAYTALARQHEQPDAPPGIEAALVKLRQGETEDAERIFATIVDRKAADIQEAAAALRHLGALTFLHDTNKALHAYRRAVELDPNNADGCNQLGHLLRRVGQLDEAVAAYQRVHIISKETGNIAFQAAASGNLGIVHAIRGDLQQAETMYRQALTLGEALEDKEGMANAYGNLGIVYRIRGDLDQAEAMHLKSLALYQALKDKGGMANAYGNLGIVYQKRGDLDQAEAMHLKSLTLEEALGRKEGMASDYGNLGNIYRIRGDLQQAEAMYQQVLVLYQDLGDKRGMANAYGSLGIVYRIRRDLDQAEAMYEKALALFQQIGATPQVKQVADSLRTLHAR